MANSIIAEVDLFFLLFKFENCVLKKLKNKSSLEWLVIISSSDSILINSFDILLVELLAFSEYSY